MSNDLLVSLLAATDLFGSFSADELAACAAAFRPIRAKKGALLFTRGDAGTHLYTWSKVGSGWQSPPRMGAS
jgi:hypothetical protein